MKEIIGKWVVVSKNNVPNIQSIGDTEIKAKIYFMDNGEIKDWHYWRNLGYRCIKVNITFTEVK